MKRHFRYRSARTGRYVSRAYAEKHPKTTVREVVKPCTSAPAKARIPTTTARVVL